MNIVRCIVVMSGLALLAGCCWHKSARATVPSDMTTAYLTGNKGQAIEWDADETGEFTIVFSDDPGPCKPKDKLSGIRVICHLVEEGSFQYHIEPGKVTGPETRVRNTGSGSKGQTNSVTPMYVKAPSCTSCGHRGMFMKFITMKKDGMKKDEEAIKTKAITSLAQSLPAISVFKAKVVTQNQQSVCTTAGARNVPANDLEEKVYAGNQLSWIPAGVFPKNTTYSAIWDDGVSPCHEKEGPFNSKDSVCTILDSAAGKRFGFTVQRSDCESASPSYSIAIEP